MKYFFKYLLSFFPRALPTGRQEFERLYNDVIYLSGKGIPDNRSVRFALSQMITMAKKARVPVRYFVNEIHKVAANQVGAAIYNETKEKQMKEWDEEKAKANAEAVATKLNEATAQVVGGQSEIKH